MKRISSATRTLPTLTLAMALGTMGAFFPAIGGQAVAAEKAVPAEKNPPGDIPDSQVFIDYASSQGFTMKVP
ncbi:hypothetical protein EN979_37155, partial [Mesorhizobium sp. M7A.F.Ca.US.001.04.2.1]